MNRDDLIAYLSELMGNTSPAPQDPTTDEEIAAARHLGNPMNDSGYYGSWGAYDDTSQSIPFKDQDRPNETGKRERYRQSPEVWGPNPKIYPYTDDRSETAADIVSDEGRSATNELYPLLQEMLQRKETPLMAPRSRGPAFAEMRRSDNERAPIMLDDVINWTRTRQFNPEAASGLLEVFRKARPNQAADFDSKRLSY